MVDRMMRAVRADVTLYEEAEHRPELQQEAYTIVGIVAAISAVFALLGGLLAGDLMSGLITAVAAGVMSFVGYLIWSYLTYFIGTRVFNATATPGEVQRALGYAWTPQILVQLLTLLPLIGACLAIVPGLWSLYLGFIASRQSLDLDNQKTLITVGLAFVAQFVLNLIVFSVLGLGGLAAGAITGN